MATQPRPLSRRKLDLLYLVFFIIHVPIMFLIDLSPILPESPITPLSRSLVGYHLERFQDRFFTNPPTWFTMYMYLEVVYHVPISLWLGWGLWNDHPLVPLNLLIFALEVAITTATCIADITSWPRFTSQQKGDIFALYAPYLALSCLMGIDAFLRVKSQILLGHSHGGLKAKTG